MANILPRDKQIEVLQHLVEGNTLRSTTRLTGIHRTTISNLTIRFGEQCRRLMNGMFRNLDLDHCQVDEVWTFVAKKQARLTVEEKALRGDIGDIYLWTVFDESTKLVPCFRLGKRSADMARRLMVDLYSRLNKPIPHASDSHDYKVGRYEPITQISTDGFPGYPEAVDLAFGPYVDYGSLIKNYRNASMKGTYAPPEIIGTKRHVHRGNISEFDICTSHVERHNLTVRTLLKRFTRLSLGFSKKLDNLEAAVAMFMAYYNLVWRTRHDDDSGMEGKLRPTAAMMARVTDRLWTFENLYDAAMAA
jgi:IS1 family transposase